MTRDIRKKEILETALLNVACQRTRVAALAAQLGGIIRQKQHSLGRLVAYAGEYENRNTVLPQGFAALLENETAFAARLAGIIKSEEVEIERLQQRQLELLRQFGALREKTDGLEHMHETVSLEIRRARMQQEDMEQMQTSLVCHKVKTS